MCDRFTMDHGPRQTPQFAKCKEKSVCEPKCKVMAPGFKRHNGICLLPSSNVCTQQGPLGGSRSVAVVKFHFKCQRRCLRALCSRTADTVGNAWLRRGGEGGVFSRRFTLKRRREGEKKSNSCRIPFVRLCGSDEETDADLHLDFGITTPRGNK